MNREPSESEGRTIILMERAGRFIRELRCGGKDSRLFEDATEIICELVESTDDIPLIA